MKKLYVSLICAASLLAACSPDSDFTNDITGNDTTQNGGNQTGSSSTVTPAASISDLTSMNIAIDETALTESDETIPSDETADNYEDYIENNEFTNEVAITFNGTSASYTGDVSGVTVTLLLRRCHQLR